MLILVAGLSSKPARAQISDAAKIGVLTDLSGPAVRATGTVEPFEVVAKMRETAVEYFFSSNGKLGEDGLMLHDLVLMQVKSPGEPRYPWDYFRILTHIPGGRAFGPPNLAAPLGKP